MAKSKAGEGIDEWIANLGKSDVVRRYKGEIPLTQEELDRHNAVDDFISSFTRHGTVRATSDSAGRSVEEHNARMGIAPGVRGPLLAGHEPSGSETGPANTAIERLIRLITGEHEGRNSDQPTKLEVSDANRAADTAILKLLGKPGKALNKGLM